MKWKWAKKQKLKEKQTKKLVLQLVWIFKTLFTFIFLNIYFDFFLQVAFRLLAGMFANVAIEDCVTSKFIKKLPSLDLEGVASYLKTCKNVVCMVGAGISTCKWFIVLME